MVAIILAAAELTPAGRPILLTTETECSLLSGVQLLCEDDDHLRHFSLHLHPGLLTLTTQRLILTPENSSPAPSPSSSLSRPCSIPLASITHIFALKKSIKAMFGSPRLRFQLSVDSEGRVGESGRSVVITAVMRGKGDVEGFVDKFRRTWEARVWERDAEGSGGVPGLGGGGSSGHHFVGDSGSGHGGFDARGMRVVGVSGILRREQEIWESTDKSLHEAFQDLNALMSKAKEMVLLAEKMRLKLLSGQSQGGDEELGTKEEMQDWLLSVGVISPVTKESAGALYHQQLSRQLADFVRIPLERAGGMINLIDMYCLFNRARGTELISPEDLFQACSLWEKFDVPVMLRKFDSGVMVIQNKAQRDAEVFTRIKSLVTRADTLQVGISASDAAITLGIAPALAKEHLLAAESQGLLCRDISPNGFRFYINLFPEIHVDDIYLCVEYELRVSPIYIAHHCFGCHRLSHYALDHVVLHYGMRDYMLRGSNLLHIQDKLDIDVRIFSDGLSYSRGILPSSILLGTILETIQANRKTSPRLGNRSFLSTFAQSGIKFSSSHSRSETAFWPMKTHDYRDYVP